MIGGEEVRTGDDLRGGRAARTARTCSRTVHKGGAKEVERAIAAAADAWKDWSRTPWEERAAVFLRAAELLAGPWRQTLNAATMLGQSKTAHQAEIDAACELIDFWRFNVKYMTRIYAEQPVSSPGVWNRLEYRPLEGFVFAVTPFNFTAIGGNLPTSVALMGNTVVWKPASTAAYSAYFLMKLYEEAGLPPGVINLVYGSGAEVGDPALASPDLAGIHFTGSTAVFNGMWRSVAGNLENYRNYPRIVGETGGKDFIVAHPSADVDALATAIVRGSFEYQGQKCSAASRVFAPSNLWPELKERLVEEVRALKVGNVNDFGNFMGAVIDGNSFKTQKAAIDEANDAGSKASVLVGGGYDDSDGWFVEPTVIETTDPGFRTMREELFGPVVTAYVYPEKQYEQTLDLIDGGAPYGLTGAVFSRDRSAVDTGTRPAALRGGQLLRQRQAHGRGRRPAAVRRRARVGDERQGGLDVEPDPLGLAADDQGALRAADRLPVPLHGAGRLASGLLRAARGTPRRPRRSRRRGRRTRRAPRGRPRCSAAPWPGRYARFVSDR